MDDGRGRRGGAATLRRVETDDLVLGGLPFRRADANGSRWSRRRVDALLRRGVLREPLHGVLVDARAADTLGLRAASVALVLPVGAAVCRTTAAWLWGVDCREPGRHLSTPPVECVVPAGATPVRRPGVRCFSAPLAGGDVDTVGGVPCTSALRTALDCARYLPPFLGLGTIDAMAHAGLVVPAGMAGALEAFRGDRFVDRARRLVRICEPRTESFGESWVRLRCVDAGFGVPEAQVNLPDDAHPRWRLDLGYRRERVGIEYDGEQYHSTDQQRAHDERRRADCLSSFGWTVLGVTRAEVLGPSMDLERAVGELLSRAPQIRRRLW